MRNPRRILQYKILAAFVFSILVIVLTVQVKGLVKLAANDDYELNKKINDRNKEYAKANLFYFTDRQRATQKPKGVYRIAVLGDSFIWGDGMPYEKVWSHKLERNLLKKYDSIEVMSWGLPGWSTLDEFNFYKSNGKDYDVDLLIIAWVDNDPDVGKIKQKSAGDPEKVYPVTYKISPALAQAKINEANNEFISLWTREIYGPQNLEDYQVVLNQFNQYLANRNTAAVVVMTPSLFSSYTKAHFDTIKPHIVRSGFTCLDLYEPLQKKLGHYSNERLQANAVNKHPGDLLTEEFANEVQDYLEQNGYLKNLPKRAQ